MEIGRYSEKEVGLDFFGKGVILASFHIDGKTPQDIEKLRIWHRMGRISSRIGSIIKGLFSYREGMSIDRHTCPRRVGDFRLILFISPGFLTMFIRSDTDLQNAKNVRKSEFRGHGLRFTLNLFY